MFNLFSDWAKRYSRAEENTNDTPTVKHNETGIRAGFLIKGGNEQSRKQTMSRLIRREGHTMFGKYPNDNNTEIVMIFSWNSKDLNDINDFDEAKALVQSKSEDIYDIDSHSGIAAGTFGTVL